MKNRVYEYVKIHQSKNTTIGFGSYGQVKLAKDIQTNSMVAIKLLYGRNAQKQIFVHYKLIHPNIIALVNDYYDKQKNITYMVMEYADGGTLYDKIKNSFLSKDLIRTYFYQICQGIKYLHQNNLVHRDIKPQNILLTKKNQVKICDFGFATLVGDRMSVCGTYQYMSPEMIKQLPYNQKIDIWALGILLFEMIEGTAPFRGDSPEQVISSMKQSIPFSEKFQSDQISLIKMILRVNSINRPSIQQILEHKYFDSQKLSCKDSLNISITSTKASEQQYIGISNQKTEKESPTLMKKTTLKTEMIYKPQGTNELSFNMNSNKISKNNTDSPWQFKSKLTYCKSIQDFRQKKKF